MNLKAVDLYIKKINNGLKPTEKVEDADVADYLANVKKEDEKRFVEYLNSLPIDLKAQTFLELPYVYQVELINQSSPDDLALLIEQLESDDATDLLQAIASSDTEKENATFELLSDKKQEEIEQLIHYSDEEAGSLMQTELLKVNLGETVEECIQKLKELKNNIIGSFIQYIFVVDEKDKLLKTIAMDDLILEDRKSLFKDIIDKYPATHTVASHSSIESVLNTIEKYDLTTLPVVDRNGHLIGRITHDDIIDIMQEHATKQIYALSNINQDEELQDNYFTTTKSRASWLFINLINAILASIVIGFFEETLDAIVALAILLPIVANMAGTASVQTMTVIIRQMAIGELKFTNIKPIFQKEFNVALTNGLLFGFISFLATQFWFENILISVSMGLSMFVSIVSAGILGTLTPILIKKTQHDPAIASSVIVITVVDIIGFFTFLWFSTVIVL